MSGERLPIPERPEVLASIIKLCWHADPNQRPDFETIIDMLKSKKEKEIDSENPTADEPAYQTVNPEDNYNNLNSRYLVNTNNSI